MLRHQPAEINRYRGNDTGSLNLDFISRLLYGMVCHSVPYHRQTHRSYHVVFYRGGLPLHARYQKIRRQIVFADSHLPLCL